MALKGIDVSKHNGKIDWKKVKDSGIDFAIIRIGYGRDIPQQDDPQAVRNMDECERLGIPYGVYLYSYAVSVTEAASEAKHMLRMIKGRNIKVGIWFDMEDADGYKIKKGLPLEKNGELYSNICKAFTDEIKKAGYDYTGIYTSKYVLENVLDKNYIESVKVWVAQWNDKCTYSGKYEMWQYSAEGKVDGSSARTDMNLFYGNLEVPAKPTQAAKPVQNKPATKYSVSQKVIFSTCYKSSTDNNNKVISAGKMLRNYGTITKIKNGTAHPYLLDDGLCWVGDSDIRGLYKENTIAYFKKYTGNSVSIVDALQHISVDSSYNSRTKIAKKNGINNYTGTAHQNTQLLNLLKQGKLIK